MLEVKGEDDQQNQTKRRFLDEWRRPSTSRAASRVVLGMSPAIQRT